MDIPAFRSQSRKTFSSFGSRDMFACFVEMNDGTGWRPVFTSAFASEYGNESVCDFVYVRKDRPEMILRETLNPARDEPPVVEDHGGANTGFASLEQFAWWRSTDGGATWSIRADRSEPSSGQYWKLEVAG